MYELKAVLLNWGTLCSPGDTCRCLEASLVVTTSEEGCVLLASGG